MKFRRSKIGRIRKHIYQADKVFNKFSKSDRNGKLVMLSNLKLIYGETRVAYQLLLKNLKFEMLVNRACLQMSYSTNKRKILVHESF